MYVCVCVGGWKDVCHMDKKHQSRDRRECLCVSESGEKVVVEVRERKIETKRGKEIE